jgi:hypothetical protein
MLSIAPAQAKRVRNPPRLSRSESQPIGHKSIVPNPAKPRKRHGKLSPCHGTAYCVRGLLMR